MRNLSLPIVLLALGTAGCATLDQVPDARLGTAQLTLANGLPAGRAILTAAGDQVSLSIAATGIPSGAHGMHLHTTGKCEAPAFTSAGSHLNPGGHPHGTDNPKGSHLGDLPNLVADQNGIAALTVKLSATRAEAESALFDGDGTAIVIHATADDYRTDPTGNSGARIACGVLTRG